MKAIVLAGGLGTRLRHITVNTPKPMAPVKGVPFLEYVLDYLVCNGVDEIVLAVSYKREMIEGHFGGGFRGVPVRYSVEDEPLGTGGAILQALEQLALDEAVVVNGDTLFPVDLGRMQAAHRVAGSVLTMAVREMPDAGRFGRLEIDTNGIVTGFLEKGSTAPGVINGGVYILRRELFDVIPLRERFSFETDLLEQAVARIKPLAFASQADFIDIGIPSEYERAQEAVNFG